MSWKQSIYYFSVAITIIGILINLYASENKLNNPIILHQSKIQAYLRPAEWISGIKKFHFYERQWKIKNIANENILETLKTNLEKVNLDIRDITKTQYGYTIEAWFLTDKMSWLNVFNFDIDLSKTTINTKGLSTGLFPITTPFAPILNIIFFWFPFDDWKVNQKIINQIQSFVN